MPPPIRYPLPTLAAVVLVALLLWKGSALARPVLEALAERVRKAAAGPDFPASSEPRVIAGAIRDRVLLLHDDTKVTDRPGGATVETIGPRGFADVYDVWPLSGEATHYRIGNRSPLGWVEASDLIHWPTRLAGSVPDATAVPILGWRGGRYEVATWEPGRAWQTVAQVGWTGLERSEMGALLSRSELVALLGQMIADADGTGAEGLRVRALIGRVLDGRGIGREAIDAARKALPPEAVGRGPLSVQEKTDGLARLNESWTADARWGGMEFRLVPLDLLP